MFAKPSEPEKPQADALRNSQFPPPISSLFSMDLPGLASQAKAEKASTEQQLKPASSASLLSSLESSAKNYLLQQQAEVLQPDDHDSKKHDDEDGEDQHI